ncbi:MAG: TlpA disulfide reductase family protein [Flavobacteriales bacterium]|nr:MAG: TlpA disulfide reductase family protein [Flavobacteriales bacterium]
MPKCLRFLLTAALLSAGGTARAQEILGSLGPASVGEWITIYGTRGTDHFPLDSARISGSGAFRFAPRAFPLGYYRLGFANDQVDLILGAPGDARIRLDFSGRPLQEHITVSGSTENQRLWEYKWASREAQRRLRAVTDQRAGMDPRDTAGLNRLSQEERTLKQRQQEFLARLMAQDTASYFAQVAALDQRLMSAMQAGPAAVRNAMRWSDPSLLRSSLYPKAIMALLQSTTPASPGMLRVACDSLLHWSSPDTACWSFTRTQLIAIFSAYGPEEVLQHVVDHYVMGPLSLVAPDAALLADVAVQLKASIGAMAPDVALPSPITGRTDRLAQLVQANAYTALFFYSSTCDHCHAEMPGLSALHNGYAEKGFGVVGIALDDDEAEFRRNIMEMALPFPCYTELAAWGSPAAKAFGVKATPWLILVDRTGRIVAKPNDHIELGELLGGLLP